ncbi:MAG: BNR repeat-containing protein [Planctomycetota bacterium]|jgi:hypothetical protein
MNSIKPLIALLWIASVVVSPVPALAELTATKIRDSVVDPRALTIDGNFGQGINGLAFQQDAVATHNQHQYVGFYDAERRVCLARRKLPTGQWRVIRFNDYDFKSNDAHNTISIGICPQDGTIHLAFDHHGHPLHYRVSQKGVATQPDEVRWDASLFGPITSELETGHPIKLTYPRFWQTPDGGLQFCYRRGGSGNGDRMLVDYDPQAGVWLNTRQIDSGKGPFEDAMGASQTRCSYPNGYDYGPNGALHTTWVWRESSQGSNHDLMYAYSQDRGKTWLNNDGQPLAEPPHVNSPGITVARIGRDYGLMNTHGQAVDSQGRVHVVMWHCTDASLKEVGSHPGEERWGPFDARRYHHYWRETNGVWRHTELEGVAGNRPKIFLDAEDNAYMIYQRRTLDRSGPIRIAAATASSGWTDWQTIYEEAGPFLNDLLGDRYRWAKDGTLSVLVQQTPGQAHEPTPLRILDFTFTRVD